MSQGPANRLSSISDVLKKPERISTPNGRETFSKTPSSNGSVQSIKAKQKQELFLMMNRALKEGKGNRSVTFARILQILRDISRTPSSLGRKRDKK